MGLIRNGRIETDDWLWLEAAAEADAVPAHGRVIVPLGVWQDAHDALLARGDIGVWLDGADEPSALAGDVGHLPLIAVHFGKFNDGRGYSAARLLRERYGFAGELRAFGDVLRDQLLFMQRSGFDAFQLREDQDAHAALAAFGELRTTYQANVVQPQPLFRRRDAAPGA
jgi:uncharacterized protein (DUF934 family)